MFKQIRSGKIYIGVIAVIAVIGIGAWFLYTKGPLGPTKVVVAKVHKESLQPSVFGIGTVEARLSYTVGPTQAGRLLSVTVDQGDTVQAGQVMGAIDPVDLDSKLISASAAVTKAQSALGTYEAQVKESYSRHILTQSTARRYQELFAAQAVSAEAVEVKQNEATAARAAYESAQAMLSVGREEISRTLAERDVLNKQRANLSLVSPANALVVAREVEPGATVVAGQAVFRMVDPTTLWVKTRIDQAKFYGIAVGQTADIVLRSRQDSVLTGKVARLDVQGDSVTEERFVSVGIEGLNGVIPLGELAEVTIRLPAINEAQVVPTAAIKRVNKQTGVWMVENNRLRFQPVVIGAQTLDGKTQIIDGLSDGATVVTYSAALLSEGMSVRVEKKP